MNPYGQLLLLDNIRACESKQEYTAIREKHLHALWAEQKWLTPLLTHSGKTIEVISPGIWNTGAGPDFLKASLSIDGTFLHGDIEIHLKDDGWELHGHHKDTRYNDVILHLSLFQESQRPLIKENQTNTEQCYLDSFLTVDPYQLTQLIDLDLYPYKEFLGSGSCAHTLFHDLDQIKIEDFFHQAALWRSSKKYDTLNFLVDDSAEFLVAGIAQALGFKKNSEPFLQLYRYVNRLDILDEKTLLATLMKLCGFFHDKYLKLWENDSYYNELFSLAPKNAPLYALNLHQIRPLNHPLRRLVYLSKFLTDPRRHFIQTDLMNLWDSIDSIESPRVAVDLIKTLIPTYPDPYFEKRFLFGDPTSTRKLGLIGDETKSEILINVFIPFLQNTMNSRNDQLKISKLLKAFPHRLTGKIKYLIHRFFGQSNKKEILLRGDLQQGAYQLHKDFCHHFESSCEGCPFVKRYKNSFK